MRALRSIRRRRVFALPAILAATFAGCGRDAPEPEPVPVEVSVGVHRVDVIVPHGWTSLDHGLERRIRRGAAELRIGDLGPVTPGAFVREIEDARALFRAGRNDDARERIAEIQLRQAFGGTREWLPADAAWNTLSHSRSRAPGEFELDAAFSAVLFSVSTFSRPPLREIVDRVLPELDSSAHREIAELRPLEIGGREALRVETWDKLSHDHRAQFLFVLNRGHLLVLWTGLGGEELLRPVFETIATSLRFEDGAQR